MAIQAQMYSENLGFPLGGSQDWMDNACGMNDFSFNLQQQQQQQQLQQEQQNQYLQYLQLQQKSQLLFLQNSMKTNDNNNNQSMVFSQGISSLLEKQKQETDTFIKLQNERLRLGILQQRKQQLQSILNKYECRAQVMLREKDEEIANAMSRTMELEDFLRRTEMEAQIWQKVAKENEAMVFSLSNTIEQMRESNVCFSNNNGIEDAESCCETGDRNRGGDDRQEQEQENFPGGNMVCKSCNSGNSCVVLLPCRHLCSCKACEMFLDSCPVCRMVKKGSIQVLF